MKNRIIVISGPTATGKTKTSIELAKLLGGEIVNFDSLVFYKELNIGSAKPTSKEMQGVKHHLVGSISIQNPINAADFQKEAIATINSILKKDTPVILVGGSGFYLQTLLKGMYKGGSTSKEVLDKSDTLYKESGITPFLEILKEVDSKSFERYHANDHYRVRRAVEFYWSTNQPFSTERENMSGYELESPAQEYNWNIEHIHLDIDKERHFEVIQNRTNQMIQEGLVQEVENILNEGFSSELKPLNSIGYKETIQFLSGGFDSQDEYVERINISTRQLAKSQRTWFKKMNLNTYNPLDEFDTIMARFKK